LTPDDIAEIVVFAAGRRENVVLADTLVFPNHQVRFSSSYTSSSHFPLTKTGGGWGASQEVIDGTMD
jgi:hypothetical protein